MLPLDPDADYSRRAWLSCPSCHPGEGCPDCGAGRNCDTHWLYLLANQGWTVHLQCPSCYALWTQDTR